MRLRPDERSWWARTVSDTDFCQGGGFRHVGSGRRRERGARLARRRARAAARRASRRPGRQVDLAPRRPDRGDLRRRDADHGVRPLGRHRSDDRSGARARDRRLRARRGDAPRLRARPRRPRVAGRTDRLRQRGDARAPDRRDPRRPGGRDASSSRATTPSRAGRWSGSPSRCADMGAQLATTEGHLPLGDRRDAQLHGDRLRAPGRERAGEVRGAARRAVRRRRDDRRRAGPDPRPHRAHAAGGRRKRHRPPDERHRPPGRAALARRDRGPGGLLVRGALRGRRDARPGVRAPRPRRQPQPETHRPARDPRPDGGEHHGLQPPLDRRRARRRPRDPLRPARRHDGRRG